jgi:hypothetical protein
LNNIVNEKSNQRSDKKRKKRKKKKKKEKKSSLTLHSLFRVPDACPPTPRDGVATSIALAEGSSMVDVDPLQ